MIYDTKAMPFISEMVYCRVYASHGLFTHWMHGAGQPTAGLNHFPLSGTGEPPGFRSTLVSNRLSVLYGKEGGFAGSF